MSASHESAFEFDAFHCNRPTIAVGDVHGTIAWKNIVNRRRPGDRLIFLGDYFDRSGAGPFASDEKDNFLEICAYCRSNPDTYLLLGNHDYQYLPFASWPYYPWERRAQTLREALMQNLDLLNIIFVDEEAAKPLIFTHGGLCQTFMRNNRIQSVAEINSAWRSRPEIFDFVERDPQSGRESDPFGDDPWQTPIWTRLMALTTDGVKGFNQVVGHTVTLVPEIETTLHQDSFLTACTMDATLIRLR